MFTFHFISKQVKIKSGKTPRGKKLPRYKIFEKNFHFDESTVPLKRLIGFECQYCFLTSAVSYVSTIFFDKGFLFNLVLFFKVNITFLI